MKTSEFKKKIEELGFELGDDWGEEEGVYVHKNKNGDKDFVELSLTDDYIYLDNNLKELDKELRDELVATCMDYAFTPIEERKDEKKYYWKIKNENYGHVKTRYLSFHEPRLLWHIGTKRECEDAFITQFTEKEYKKMVVDSFIPDIFEKEEI